MNAIVAVDSEWGIGRRDSLLFRIREDLKRLKRMTVGKTIIVGRRTLQTFPAGQPLADRRNLVLSHNPDLRLDGAEVFGSVQDLLDVVRDLPSEEVYVLGGDSVYRQLLPFCERAFITHVEGRFDADAFFPNLAKHKDWVLVDEGALNQDVEMTYRWAEYRNINLQY